jgi:transposase-like protein
MNEYEVINVKKLDQWLEDSRSNPDNFMSGLLYEFGRAEHVVIDKLQAENAELKAVANSEVVEFQNSLANTYEKKIEKLQAKIEALKTPLREIIEDFKTMEYSSVGKDSQFHKRIMELLKETT